MIFAPLWVMSLLGAFFQLVGQKAQAEIKKEQIKEAKRAKAIEKRRKKLKKQEAILKKLEESQLAKAKAEFARVEKSKKVVQEIKTKIASLCVELDEHPYRTEDATEPEDDAP